MRAHYGEPEQADRPVRRFISRNLSLLAFLGLSAAVMFAAYTYFSPTSGVAEVVAAGDLTGALTAPLVKPVPVKPVRQRLQQSPGPVRIGIIIGHKNHDSGAVCEDGLTEFEVNENVAARLYAALQTRGVPADLLEEFDPRLKGYVATALISLHADSCDYINELATGFKIAGSGLTDSSALSICVQDAYARATNLTYHANTLTPDMADYHAFREIAPGVPGIIIELGFMNLDRQLLTTQPDLLAQALADGIMCYVDQVRGGAQYVRSVPSSGAEP